MGSQFDEIINVMKRVIDKSNDFELTEQGSTDAGGGAADSGGETKPEYPTVTKWESGVTRGPANQIGLTKWSDIVKVTRGKANTLL